MTLLSQGALFQSAERQALEAIFLRTQSPPPAPTYLALSTTAIGALQSTELTMAGTTINEYPLASGYARQNYGPSASLAASPSKIWNSVAVTWGPFTSAPGTANWAIACDGTGSTANTIASFVMAARTPAVGDSLQAGAGTGLAGAGFICQV
jgi:hypothetical protein